MFIFNNNGYITLESLEEGKEVLDALYALGWKWRSGATPPRHYKVLETAYIAPSFKPSLFLERNGGRYGSCTISYDTLGCVVRKRITGKDFLKQYREYIKDRTENA